MTDEWMNKMRYSYTMEYYLPVKRNEVLLYATVCMNIENIMPSISQTQRPHIMISFVYNV